jgi:hypothetical protein
MRIVAIDAQVIGFGAVPVTRSLPVNAIPPVSVLDAVTLSAQEVALTKRDQFAVAQRKKVIPLFRMMTVQAPDFYSSVIQFDVLMDQKIFPPLKINGKILLRPVARAARSYGLR